MTPPRATDPVRKRLDRMAACSPLLPEPGEEAMAPLIAALRAVFDIVDVWADQQARGGAPDAIPVDGLRLIRYAIDTALGLTTDG